MKFRFAFSTSDVPHVENLREALFGWGLSRHLGGDFVVTVTDDGAGWRPMLEALRWLGVDWDEGPDQTAENWWGDEGIEVETVDDELLTAVSPMLNNGLATLSNDHQLTLNLPSLTLTEGAALPLRGYCLADLQDAGYLPQAVVNYLLLLGWQPKDNNLIMDKWRVRQEFAPAQISQEAAVFDWATLRKLNQHYIQQLSGEALAEEIRPFLEDAYGMLPNATGWLTQLALLIQPQISTLEESIEAAEFALSEAFEMSEEGTAVLADPTARLVLTQLIAEVAHVVLLDSQTAQSILSGLKTRLAERGITAVQIEHPIHAALSGKIMGSPLPQMMGIIGKQRTLQRIAHALRNHSSIE